MKISISLLILMLAESSGRKRPIMTIQVSFMYIVQRCLTSLQWMINWVEPSLSYKVFSELIKLYKRELLISFYSLHPRTYEINREGDVTCVHRAALDLFPGPRHAVVVVCLHLPQALLRAPPTCIHWKIKNHMQLIFLWFSLVINCI